MPITTATILAPLLFVAPLLVNATQLPAQCTYTWQAGAFAGGCNDVVNAAIYTEDKRLIVGGRFTLAGVVGAPRIAHWDGVAWLPLGGGTSGEVRAIAELPNGDIIAAGDFALASIVLANGIARWDGSAWNALASGGQIGVSSSGFAPASIRALSVLSNGDLIVGGVFDSAGGVVANNIARWDGTAWSAFGTGCNGPVESLAALQANAFVATGDFTLADGNAVAGFVRWAGTGFLAYGSFGAGLGGRVLDMRGTSGGYVGGAFTIGGLNPINRVAKVLPGGQLEALNGGVNGPVSALAELPIGVVAGGSFTMADGAPASNIARWDGGAWNALGSGVDAEVRGLVLAPSQQLVVVGSFSNAGGNPAGGIALVSSSCSTQVANVASGCVGAAGLNDLQVTQIPTLGTRMEAVSTGYPAGSLGLAITSLYQVGPLPVSQFLPSYPGCTFSVNLDYAEVMIPSGGSAESVLFVPLWVGFLGFQFVHQHAVIEVDSNAVQGIGGISTSNAVGVTIGAF